MTILFQAFSHIFFKTNPTNRDKETPNCQLRPVWNQLKFTLIEYITENAINYLHIGQIFYLSYFARAVH